MEEERASGRPTPLVHADNKEELIRIRAMTATRELEEKMLNRARVLQESENRARERAEARQAQARQALERQVQVRQALEIDRQAQEGEEALERGLVLLEAEQRLEAALEGAARFNAGAWEAREVELARQERDRIAFREREAQRMARADQPPPQLPPNMDGIPLEDRWRVWRDYERHASPPNMMTEEGLARMVALPVLRETAIEATECPICIEDLGEVGKTVLKCGHTLCVSCFLQQTLRATATRGARDCACPVCRVNYIM
jgi:hypothetical protein